MPSRGDGLSYDELQILRAWLGAEKDSLLTVAELDAHEALFAAVERRYRLNLRPLPYVERAHPAPVALDNVPTAWQIRPLSAHHTTLDVRLLRPDLAKPEDLRPYAANITRLDLRGVNAADDWLAALPDMPHVTQISWARTGLSDAQVARLAGYAHLTNINLTGTQVSDAGLRQLETAPALERLFIYDSRVSEAGRAAFAAATDVEVPGRFAFTLPE